MLPPSPEAIQIQIVRCWVLGRKARPQFQVGTLNRELSRVRPQLAPSIRQTNTSVAQTCPRSASRNRQRSRRVVPVRLEAALERELVFSCRSSDAILRRSPDWCRRTYSGLTTHTVCLRSGAGTVAAPATSYSPAGTPFRARAIGSVLHGRSEVLRAGYVIKKARMFPRLPRAEFCKPQRGHVPLCFSGG